MPNTIERLVTLDGVSLEYAIALGLKPVGAAWNEGFSSHLQDQLANVENIGQAGEPNLERVLALKPDLILGLDSQQTLYAQASQIAPTVLLKFEHSGQWKDVFQTFSKALNRDAIAQQVMANYNRRLQDFKNRPRAKATPANKPLPSPPEVSVVRIYPDSINLYLRDSFCGTILQDAGLARPAAQDIGASEAKSLFDNQIQVSISLERIDQADGDIMFIWTSENTTQGNQTTQKKLAELRSNSLWQSLNATQQERVYFVPSYWIGSGPIAANAVIDDLFNYIKEQ